jgi:hypothetical protein
MFEPPVLGKIIEGQAFRDAIHIAVAPVVAGCDIRPGAHVQLNTSRPAGTELKAIWCEPDNKAAIGIADPFLKEEIKRGQTFWLFLYPGTAEGLRHAWLHPAFRAVAPEAKEPDHG